MKKRLVSLVLAVTLCLSLLPGTVLAAGGEAVQSAVERIKKIGAGGDVTYISAPSRYYQVPILSATMMNDSNILNEYVYKNGGLLNGGSEFYRYDWNSVNMAMPPYTLSDAYDWAFQRINNDSTWRARYRMSVYSDFATLARSGQLSYLFSAELKYDRHMKAGKHAHVIFRDFAVARLYSGYESNQYMELINNKHQPEESWNFMSSGWSRIPTDVKSDLTLFFWHDEGDRCWDGASGVRKAAIAFGDDVYPYVTKAEVLNSGKTYYNSGSFDFKIYFSEPIRTFDASSEIASNSPAARIRLAAYDRETRQSQEIYAALTSTGSNSLTYRFNVPTDKQVDIIITGIAGADFQRDTILSRNQDLKVYTSKDTYETIYRNGTAIKVNATYTDYAGNGIDEAWRAVSFPQEIHIDTVAPTYTNTVIESGSMIRNQDFNDVTDDWYLAGDTGWSNDEIDRSQVFAGVGDWLNLAVDFSEELKKIDGTGAAYGTTDGEHFIATLNIIDNDTGENVTLKGSTIFSMQTDINNNRPISRLRFKTLAITDKMKPDTTNPGPIKIISITTDQADPNTVYDMCDNLLDLSTLTAAVLKTPDKQEMLDTVAPTAQASDFGLDTRPADNIPESWKSVLGYDDSKADGIKLRLQVNEATDDTIADSLQYRSGTAGVGENSGEWTQEPGHLTISGVGAAKYQYAVKVGDGYPGAEDWTTVTGDAKLYFPQPDEPVYLHIRMAEDSQVPIFGFDYTIDGYDYAGNPSTSEKATFDPSAYPEQDMNIYEHTAPTSTADFTAELMSDGTKEVISSFTVTDLGGITEVWYKQVNQSTGSEIIDPSPITAETMGDPGSGGGWVKVDGIEGEPLSVVVPEVRTQVVLRENNWVYLCIYAKDSSGNIMKEVHSFRHDMRMPKYELSVPEVITDYNEQIITIGEQSIEQAKDIGPVNVWYDESADYRDNNKWLWNYGALFVSLIQRQKSEHILTKMVDWLIDKNADNISVSNYDKPEDYGKENDPIHADPTSTKIDDVIDDIGKLEVGGVDVREDWKSVESAYGWHVYSGGNIIEMIKNGQTIMDVNYTYTDIKLFETETLSSDEVKGVMGDFVQPYYGVMDVYLTQTTGQRYYTYAVELFQQSAEKNSKPVYADRYTIKVKIDDTETNPNPINTARFHAPLAANGQLLAKEAAEEGTGTIKLSDFDPRVKTQVQSFSPTNEDMSQINFSTLEGITVPFSVGNNRVPEWGIEDIDFEKSSIEVVYYEYPMNDWRVEQSFDYAQTNNGQDGKVVYTVTGLKKDSEEQTFTFPAASDIEGGAYETGIYSVRVNIATKTFDHTDKIETCATSSDSGGFLFRVCTLTPSELGGIYSTYVVDNGVVTHNKGVVGIVKDAQWLGYNFSEDPSSEYVIPMIENIAADGTSSYDYYYPFFVYQNEYDKFEGVADDLGASRYFSLKVWTEGDEENARYIAPGGMWITVAGTTLAKTIVDKEQLQDVGVCFGVKCTGSTPITQDSFAGAPFIAEVAPGNSVVICMQEYYSNGQVGSIRKLTVSAPGTPEEDSVDAAGNPVKYAHITPNVDINCATGVPTADYTVGVNDISSLNGVSKIYMSPNPDSSKTYDGISASEWYDAEIVESESAKLLKIGDFTHFNEMYENHISPDRPTYVIHRLMYGEMYEGSDNMLCEYKNPLIIVMDDDFNTTVKEVVDFARDWDPYAPSLFANSTDQGNDEYTLSGGSYSTRISVSDTFMPRSANDMKIYITTIDPESTTGDGDTTVDTEGVTKTIAIPLGDIINGEGQQFGTYDGSTPNAPGVTSIIMDYGSSRDEYGINKTSYGTSFEGSVTITGSVPPEDNVYIYCVDELGNRSNVLTIPGGGDGSYEPPSIKSNYERADDGSLKLEFTQSVIVTDPQIIGGDTELSPIKTGLPIYSDGKYTIKYIDIFGLEYEQEITLALDGDFKFSYTMSTTELTNQPVTFNLETQDNNGAWTTIQNVEVLDTTEYDTPVIAEDTHSASVVMRENGVIKVTLKYGEEIKEKLFPINNIDTVMEDVAITWEYEVPSDFKIGEDGEYETDDQGRRILNDGLTHTSGYVTAVIHIADSESNEELIGTNGELRYTFPNYSTTGDTHKFEYMDAAGNTGEIEANLPCDIELPIPPRLTGYSMKVSHTSMTQTYDDVNFLFTENTMVGEEGSQVPLVPPDFETGIYQDDEGNVVQAKEIIINLSTDLDAKVLVLPAGTTVDQVNDTTVSQETSLGQSADGNYIVTVSGKNIRVIDNTEFVIAVVEDIKYFNNAQGSDSEDADKTAQKVYLIPVKIVNIPQLKETGILYEKKSVYEWWAWFDPMDNVDANGNMNITLTNTVSETEVLIDPDSGHYYHKFTSIPEETGVAYYTFTYRDAVGHTGQITAECTKEMIPLDREVSEGVKRWWPYEGKDESMLKLEPVNFNVSFQESFNMLIKAAGLSTDGNNRMDKAEFDEKYKDIIEIVPSLDSVSVTFKENPGAHLWLWVQGETDAYRYVDLGEVTIIDKVAPDIQVSVVDSGVVTQSKEAVFIPDEPVVCKEFPQKSGVNEVNDGYYDAEHPLTVTFTVNGDYSYTFTDRAGNTVTVPVKVENIDREAPTVVFSSDGTGDGESWAEFAEANNVAELETVYVKANEYCEYTFQGNKGELTQDGWTLLEIDRVKGGFALTATDVARNTVTQALTGIERKDTTAPVVFLSPQSISVPQGMTGQELHDAIWAGVEYSDDMTRIGPEELESYVTCDTSRLNTSATGEYVIYFSAVDAQGNKSVRVERYVRVYSATEIVLKVKGEGDDAFRITGYMNTMIMNSQSVTFQVSNLKGSAETGYEPFSLFVKKGMKTAGQMKNNSERVKGFTMTDDGSAMSASYEFTGSGYYTVYIITQDRAQYLTYLYIEQ